MYGKLLRGAHKDCLRLDYKPGGCPWPDAKWQLEALLDRLKELPQGLEVDDNDDAVGCGDTVGLLGAELTMDEQACAALPPSLRTGLLRLGGKTLPGAARFSVSVFKEEWLRTALKVETPDGPVNLHFMESMQSFPLADREAVEAFCYWKAYGCWAYLWYPFSILQFRRIATWTTQKLTAERNLGVLGKDYYSLGAFQCGDNGKGCCVTCIKMRLRPQQEQPKPSAPGLRQGFRSQLVEAVAREGAKFDLMFQFATDPLLHPINDLTVAWDEEYAPWIKVGEVRIPRQDCRDTTPAGAVGSPLGPLGSKDLLFESRANLHHVAVGDVNAFRNYCYRHYDQRRQEHLLGRPGGAPAKCPFADILKYCQAHK